MRRSHIWGEINKAIDEAYGSRAQPVFAFQTDVAVRERYAGIISELSKFSDIEEITDLNVDVSFVFLVRIGNGVWIVRLSMVGPYALILDISDPQEAPTVVSRGKEPECGERVQIIMNIIEGNGIYVLDRSILERKVDLILFETSAQNTTVYQALFCDNEVLPWNLCAVNRSRFAGGSNS